MIVVPVAKPQAISARPYAQPHGVNVVAKPIITLVTSPFVNPFPSVAPSIPVSIAPATPSFFPILFANSVAPAISKDSSYAVVGVLHQQLMP